MGYMHSVLANQIADIFTPNDKPMKLLNLIEPMYTVNSESTDILVVLKPHIMNFRSFPSTY